MIPLPTYIDEKDIERNIPTPKYIELGHELIHAYNNMKGKALYIDRYGWSTAKRNNGIVDIYVTRAEELRTTGINYFDVLECKINYYSVNDSSYINSYDFSHITKNFHGANEAMYTENKLREENGLGRRTSYIQLLVDTDTSQQESFGDWWERLLEGRL
jgi:hypothetical protein